MTFRSKMAALIGGLFGVALAATFAFSQGAQTISTLTGTELVNNWAGTVSTLFSTNTLAKYGRVANGASAALSTTSPASLDPTVTNIFTVTPSADLTINALSAPIGENVSIVVTTSGTTSYTLTFGTKFKSTGTLATGTVSGKVFTITFVGDGTNLNEISRTTAM